MSGELGNSPELPPQFSATELKQSLDKDISDYQKMIGGDIKEHVFDTNSKALGMHNSFQDLLKVAKQEGLRINRKRYATLIASSLEQEAKRRRAWMSEERIVPYTEAERAMFSRELDPLWRPGDPLGPQNSLFIQHRNRAIEMERIALRYRAALEGLGDYSFNINLTPRQERQLQQELNQRV